jgi:hypothetical protein
MEALDERLVRFVVHLAKKLPSGGVVAGAKALVEADGAPSSHRESSELSPEAELPARRPQHEACLAPLAAELDQRWTFFGYGLRLALTHGERSSANL